MLVTAVIVAALIGLVLGWQARRIFASAPAKRFEKDFAALAADTPIDWEGLQGPGPAQGTAAAVRSFVEPTSDSSALAPKTLSPEDHEYYASSWQNVRGEFGDSPTSALRLARSLTGNLLLNRGLVPADTARPSDLPASWTFRTACGYRHALRISAQADAAEEDRRVTPFPDTPYVAEAELRGALALIEDFYWEMLTLSTVPSDE